MNRIFIAMILTVAVTGCGVPDEAAETADKAQAAEANHEGEAGHAEGEVHAESEEGHAEGESSHAEEGHEEEAPGELDIDAARIASAGIKTEAAGAAEIRQTLLLFGTVTVDSSRTRDVTARFPGLVKSVRVNLGDRVAAGAVLATVESNDSLQVYAVTAPLAGTVTARNTNPGETAGDAPMFTITDLSSLTAELSAFPADRVKLRPGQAVRIHTSEGELTADGKIALIAPVGSSDNQSVAVRVPLANRDSRWATGLFVTGEVAIATSKAALAIPQLALQDIEGKPSVFVKTEHGFRTQPVKAGRNDGIHVEVLEGIAAGDVVATVNSFALKAELGKGEAEHAH